MSATRRPRSKFGRAGESVALRDTPRAESEPALGLFEKAADLISGFFKERATTMRQELKAREGKRGRFSGTVARFGQKPAYKGPPIVTMLLRDVRDEQGTQVTDHLWFTVRKQLKELNAQPGDKIEFEARVRPYRKGYRGRREDEDLPSPSFDYGLSHGTRFKKVGSMPAELVGLPLFERQVC
jgi:hypothetical protein